MDGDFLEYKDRIQYRVRRQILAC